MRHQPIHFFSERHRLDGDLYLPDGAASDAPVPAVVACSGYQGLKTIHPERFARHLTPQGYAVLAFDYRGFGASEGERGRLVPQEQVLDVRAAVSWLETVPEVDPARIGLLGWALGGGVVIAAGADDPRVATVAAVQAIGDGARALRAVHDEAAYEALLARIAADRRTSVAVGRSEVVDPFAITALDEVTRGYVDAELTRAPGFGSGVSLESADHVLRFRPEDLVGRIAPRPLLLVHGADNRLHPVAEAEALERAAGEPCELVVLDDVGHTEWMFDDHPVFGELVTTLRRFLDDHLAAQPG